MKKINIHIDLVSRKKLNSYPFRLGNGTIYDFASKRKANDFINKTNKFLTEKWYNLYNLYSMVFNEYSMITGYFHNTSKDKGFRFLDAKAREILHEIDPIMHRSITNSNNMNGNYTVFSNIEKVCFNLTRVLLTLKEIHENKSNAQQLIQCNFLIYQLQSIKDETFNWGLDKCSDIFEITKIIELPQLRVVNS